MIIEYIQCNVLVNLCFKIIAGCAGENMTHYLSAILWKNIVDINLTFLSNSDSIYLT